jgi:hypothetical protein
MYQSRMLPSSYPIGGCVFEQTYDIPMDRNCAPLIADLFLYSYKVGLMQLGASQDVLLPLGIHSYLFVTRGDPVSTSKSTDAQTITN